MGVTYDTGALLAAEANRRDIWAIHARALARGQRPTVPVGVLGQAWRGGPQPELVRFLRGCLFEELTEARARAAGVACARSSAADLVDASVVVGALARNDLVVTSDPADLERLAAGLGRRLQLHRV
jgi:hypothetical protein